MANPHFFKLDRDYTRTLVSSADPAHNGGQGQPRPSTSLMHELISLQETSRIPASMALAFLGVLGTFNRITFAAFLVIPLVQLFPHVRAK